MTNLIPKPEKLKKNEIIISVIPVILLFGAMNSVRVHGAINQDIASLMTFCACYMFILMLPQKSLEFLFVRFTRPYNFIIWLIPSLILFFNYYVILNQPALAKDVGQGSLTFFRIPFWFLIYKNLMRVVHIVFYGIEPQLMSYSGPVIIDEDLEREPIDSDKYFSLIVGLGYIIVLIILYNSTPEF